MQPVVPERGFPSIVAPNRSQPLGVAIQVREDAANIRRIEWHVDYRIWLQKGEMKGSQVTALRADFVSPVTVKVK